MKSLALARVVEMRPSILITGFLGAGKTTLLRSTLEHLKAIDVKADVILNDYANAMVDSETLLDISESIEALGASCACCEGMDFLIDMVVKTAQTKHDILLIELNGTADPLPIIESFTLLENKFKLFPRWNVCVIDARHFEDRGYYNRLERDQLETASHYVISHQEAVSDEKFTHLKKRLIEITPTATILSPGEFTNEAAKLAAAKKKYLLSESDTPTSSLSKSPYHGISHEITACQIQIHDRVAIETIKPWLEALPSEVMRAKALIDLTDDLEKRYLYERVGTQIPDTPYPVPLKSTVVSSAILIGPDLDTESLLSMTQEMLNSECGLP